VNPVITALPLNVVRSTLGGLSSTDSRVNGHHLYIHLIQPVGWKSIISENHPNHGSARMLLLLPAHVLPALCSSLLPSGLYLCGNCSCLEMAVSLLFTILYLNFLLKNSNLTLFCLPLVCLCVSMLQFPDPWHLLGMESTVYISPLLSNYSLFLLRYMYQPNFLLPATLLVSS
jgi:hypothetical protein